LGILPHLDSSRPVRYSRGKANIKRNMALARAHLESLLRARRLDRTLTTTLPALDSASSGNNDTVIAPTGMTALDSRLGGGFPRGHLSELVGPRSSGRTSVLLHMLAAATARGELVALVDALDMFDVASAAAAGVALDRLLWVRGHVVANPGLCRDLNRRALEQAIRAFTLVLQAGNFGVVVFDVAEAPADAVRRLPFTTWMRLQRLLEGSQTAGVLVGGTPMARSSSGLTLKLGIRDAGCGRRAIRFSARLFEGFEIEACVARARSHAGEEASAVFSTLAAYGA
jgi:recombination protein RecA